MVSKKGLSENSIYTHYVLPSLVKSGWDLQKQIRENVYFTDGRIYVNGKKTTRGKRKFADVILYYKPNIPVAIIEIKKNTLSESAGIQQVLDYGQILDIPVVFSTNGDSFIEHDRSGYSQLIEIQHSLECFPTPEQLWAKYQYYKGIKTPEVAKIAEFNYFFDPAGRKPRYYWEARM